MTDRPRLVSIVELNRVPRPAFGEALRPLLEAGGPLGDALYKRRPFRSYQALLDEAEHALAGLSEAERITTINAHPRIGAKAAQLRERSLLSFQEQGLDRAPDPESARVDARLAELNDAYEARFGFRFVVFVNRRPRSAIVPVLETRLAGERQAELTTAERELLAIARDRLRTLGG